MTLNEITNHHQLSKDKNNVIEDDIEDDDMEVDDIDTEAGTCGSQEDDMTIIDDSDITDDTEEITPLSLKRKREIEYITANIRRFPQLVLR